jgi:hypothetical protein
VHPGSLCPEGRLDLGAQARDVPASDAASPYTMSIATGPRLATVPASVSLTWSLERKAAPSPPAKRGPSVLLPEPGNPFTITTSRATTGTMPQGLTLEQVEAAGFERWRATCAASARWPGPAA